ncbi:MAG TPA: hypothetical protein VFY29_05855 [Terriglobia bacterium]|nr:hypothetical protein [Terriglobia bacterium]
MTKRTPWKQWNACALFLLAFATSTSQGADNGVVSGEFTVEPPTLVSLGFEWKITGDDNRNARVDSFYRKRGESQWRDGLPLMRLQNEQVGAIPRSEVPDRYLLFRYTAPNMFAGSILNLEPDTEYECRFVLSDPDGLRGAATKTVTARTRKEPQPAPGGRIFHVYPVDWTGPKQSPAFTGLLAAYYMGAAHFDYANAFPPRVEPGDTILLHAGVYKGDRFHYMNGEPRPGYLSLGNVFDGTYYLTQSGTAEKPIAIRAAGDGEVIFDGDGCQNLFNLMGGNYHYFEGITVRNTNVAFLLGVKAIAGSSGFTLKRSRIVDVGRAVQDDWSGSKNFYIADNTFTGRHDPDRMMGWTGAPWSGLPGFPELLSSEYAIKVYGQGHVVAHNRIEHWHDGIDVATYGVPDGAPNDVADRLPVSIDFYGNDIFNMGDNCIETDGGARNIRVFDNRCFNSAAAALSAQPAFGGPVYFFRNIVYNTPSGSLKYIEGAAGILTYNNTIVGEGAVGPGSNMQFRNNLILAEGARDAVFAVSTFTSYSSSDYNGFHPNAGKPVSFEWSSPPSGVSADYSTYPAARRFGGFEEYRDGSGQDRHSVLVDYNVFARVAPPDPADPQRVYSPDAFDFQLKSGTAAVDAGVALPTITDGFTGRAPDLGALEAGRPAPRYGPR